MKVCQTGTLAFSGDDNGDGDCDMVMMLTTGVIFPSSQTGESCEGENLISLLLTLPSSRMMMMMVMMMTFLSIMLVMMTKMSLKMMSMTAKVTPCTDFAKSLFGNLTVFLSPYVFLKKIYKMQLTLPPACKIIS